jgi:hypothetical protein
MNYLGFWSSFYQLLDPGGKFNADTDTDPDPKHCLREM